MTRVRVLAGHETAGVPPIRITPGDTVTVTAEAAAMATAARAGCR